MKPTSQEALRADPTKSSLGLGSLAFFVVAILSMAASPLKASASFSMLDGGALEAGKSAIHARLGVPHLGLDFLRARSDRLDVGGGLLVNYRQPSLEPGLLVRRQLAGDSSHNIGLTARAAFHWNLGLWRERQFPPNVGLRFTPAVVAGTRPHPAYSGYVMLEAPLLWTWRHGGGWAVPVRAGLGLEYGMTPDFRFVLHGALGPRIEGGGGHVGGVFVDADAWFGLSMVLF